MKSRLSHFFLAGVVILAFMLVGLLFVREKKLTAELYARNKELQVAESNVTQLRDYQFNSDQQSSQYSQYAEFLSNELSITKQRTPDKNLFTVYQYGFVFNENFKELPVSCGVDSTTVVVYSASGPQDLTVNCTIKSDRYNSSYSKNAAVVVQKYNLVTPFSFHLAMATELITPDMKLSGKTSKGRAFMRESSSNGNNKKYSYTFYSPIVEQTPLSQYAQQYKYRLDLEAFDAIDEASFDAFAGRIIDQVSFVHPDSL